MADIEIPKWRCKTKIGMLMKRVNDHANGEVEMTRTQIAAAKLFLDKTVPNLANHQITGKDEGPIKHEHTLPEQDKAILQQYLNQTK